MANDPPFATLNHFIADLGIPEESPNPRVGIKARPSAPAARCRHLHVAEHSIDRRGAHRRQLPMLAFTELQSNMLLQCWQKDRDHRHVPLAAYAIRSFPQCCDRVFDRRAIAALALTRDSGLSCDDALP